MQTLSTRDNALPPAAPPMLDVDARRFQPLVHIEEAIERPRLLQAMGSAPPATARITFLVAPAGYGKTTLLAQLAAQARRQGQAVAWLNCDARDQDAGHFAADLECAIARASTPSAHLPDAGAALGRLLAAFGSGLLLCIDEFEAASSPEVDALFERLAPELRPGQQMVVAMRDAPGPRFTRLQLAGLLRSVEVEALRFDRHEAMQLVGPVVEGPELHQVLALAEGWPLALQLARLGAASRRVGLRGGEGSRPGFPRRQVFDYLAREVTEHLPPELLALLQDTAILDAFDAALADRLRGRDDSLVLIRQLHRLKPIVSIDDGPGRVRLHPLLREYLLEQSPLESRARRAALHEAAAALLAERRQWHEAVGHAVAAGRLDAAADLIEEAGGVRLCADQGALRVRLLLEQLPEATLRQRPRLRLLRLGQLLAEQNASGAQQEFERIEQQLQAQTGTPSGPVRAELELARCMLLIHDSERDLRFSPWATLAETRRLARGEPLDDARMRAITLALELLFLHRYGPTQRCERRTVEIERLYGQGAYTFNSPWLWMYRARNALARGQLDEAGRILYEELPSDDTFVRYRQDSLSHLVQALLGRLALVQGDAAGAAERLATLRDESSMRLLEITSAAWVDGARAEHALGHGARAYELIEAARQLADDEDLVHLGLLAAATQVELRARDGELGLADACAQAMDLELLWQRATVPLTLPWALTEALARAQVHRALAGGRIEEAARMVEALRACAQQSGQRLGEQVAAVLSLLVRQRQGAARPELEATLQLAAECGAVQDLVDAGSETMAALRAWRAAADAKAPTTAWTHAGRVLRCWEASFQQAPAVPSASLLTPREIDVLRALAVDGSTKLAARRLRLSPETVKHHLKNVFGKFGVRTRDEAVAEARRRRLMA